MEKFQSFAYESLVQAVYRRRLVCVGVMECVRGPDRLIASMKGKDVKFLEEKVPIDVDFVEEVVGLKESWIARNFMDQSVFDPVDYNSGSPRICDFWSEIWTEGEWIQDGPQDLDWPLKFPIRCVIGKVSQSVHGWTRADLLFVGFQWRPLELDGSVGSQSDRYVVAGFAPILDGQDPAAVMEKLIRYVRERLIPESRVYAALMSVYDALKGPVLRCIIRSDWLLGRKFRSVRHKVLEIPRCQMPQHELAWVGSTQLPGSLDVDGVRFDVNSCEGWGQVELMDDNVQRHLETLMARGWDVEQVECILGVDSHERRSELF